MTPDPIGQLVASGSLLVALPIALLAGLISFASPCVLPLVPGYVGYVTGFTNPDEAKNHRWRVVAGVGLFVLGFAVVFVTIGVLFGTAGLLLRPWIDLITRIAGVIVIVMGFVFIGQVTWLQKTTRPRWTVATGLGGAPVLGIVFALGWTPCLGPTLIAINSIVLDQGDPVRGGLLALVYSLGLGLPFLALALGVSWASGSVAWLRRHLRAINIAGGVVLILIGLAMVTGLWSAMMSLVTSWIGGFTLAI